VILACEGLAVALIAVAGIAVLAHGGYHHRAFSGFEGAATLGEESAR